MAEFLTRTNRPTTSVLLRAAPIWDAPERGLHKRLQRAYIPQPKQGRAILDPLSLEDFCRVVQPALHEGPDLAIYGLPGPCALPAKTLALHAGARVFPLPTQASEWAGALKIFGWDHDTAITMAWSLTLGGVGARNALHWEPRIHPITGAVLDV